MDIPEDVREAADNLYWDRNREYGGLGCAEAAYEFIAEWARKQVLEESIDIAREYLGDISDIEEFVQRVRALGEAR